MALDCGRRARAPVTRLVEGSGAAGFLGLAEIGGPFEHALELRLLDGVRDGVEEFEGRELAFEHRAAGRLDREDPHDVGPAFGDLAQELEARAILEPLGRDQHVEFIRAQQVDAGDLARGDVHFESAGYGPERLGI